MTFWMLIDKHWSDVSVGIGLAMFGAFCLLLFRLLLRTIVRR